MNWREQPVGFECAGERLVGVLSLPMVTPSAVALLIVVGGPQYRVGSHRQFVQHARAVASAGHPVLRFDVRGMGDSSGDARNFEMLDDDIEAALRALRESVPAVRQVVLLGLCDGASAALLYVHRRRDADIAGLVLMNPWLRSAKGLARTHLKHYYRRRLADPAFWRKLLGGGVATQAVKSLLATLRLAARPADVKIGDFRSHMASAWNAFPGPLLLVISGDDYTAREFIEGARTLHAWQGALERPRLTRCNLPEADHTFSSREQRLVLESALINWLCQSFLPQPARSS